MTHHDIIRIPDRSAPVAENKLPSIAPLVVALVVCAGWVVAASVILLQHFSHK